MTSKRLLGDAQISLLQNKRKLFKTTSAWSILNDIARKLLARMVRIFPALRSCRKNDTFFDNFDIFGNLIFFKECKLSPLFLEEQPFRFILKQTHTFWHSSAEEYHEVTCSWASSIWPRDVSLLNRSRPGKTYGFLIWSPKTTWI